MNSTPQQRIDVGIITIKDEEHLAVLDAFGAPSETQPGLRRDYHLVTRGSQRVAITRCLQQGTNFAQAAATELLEDFDAKFVLVVGIAGGVPTTDFTLGDVVISSDIVDLTVEDTGTEFPRYSAKGLQLLVDAGRIVEQLPAILRSMDWGTLGPRPSFAGQHTTPDAAWNKNIDESFAHHLETGRVNPIARPGGIASSDRLVKDPTVITSWRLVLKGVVAAEMEAAGAGLTCFRRSVAFLAVRGISDIIGWKRNEQWTLYACKTAAATARFLVESGALNTTASNRRLIEPAVGKATADESAHEGSLGRS